MVDNRSIRPTELPAQPGLVRLMCDGIPGGIFRCLPDPVWTILEVSRGFLNLFGYTAEEMREKFHNHYLDMIHPHDRRAVTRAFQKHMETGTDHCLEYRVKHRDGHTLWILEQSHLMQRDGEPDTLCCTLTDITEGKKLQEQLRLSLERHQILMDQTDDIIIEWNMERIPFSAPRKGDKFNYTRRSISQAYAQRFPSTGGPAAHGGPCTPIRGRCTATWSSASARRTGGTSGAARA
ncbi:MAG: PAS domain-containing protein [Anaeromassilibacillus sp.]